MQVRLPAKPGGTVRCWRRFRSPLDGDHRNGAGGWGVVGSRAGAGRLQRGDKCISGSSQQGTGTPLPAATSLRGDLNASEKPWPSWHGKRRLPAGMAKPQRSLAWERWGGSCRGAGRAICYPSAEGGTRNPGLRLQRETFRGVFPAARLALLPAEEPCDEAGWGCRAGSSLQPRSCSPQQLQASVPNSTDFLPTSTSWPVCATTLVERRSERGQGRGVEFGQQNGFAGLNSFWSLKAFLACCGQALSTHHHSASAKGHVARLGERGWGTKKSFLAEKRLFITTEKEGASWAENTGRAVP